MLFYFEIWLNVPPDFHNPSFQFLINWEAAKYQQLVALTVTWREMAAMYYRHQDAEMKPASKSTRKTCSHCFLTHKHDLMTTRRLRL